VEGQITRFSNFLETHNYISQLGWEANGDMELRCGFLPRLHTIERFCGKVWCNPLFPEEARNTLEFIWDVGTLEGIFFKYLLPLSMKNVCETNKKKNKHHPNNINYLVHKKRYKICNGISKFIEFKLGKYRVRGMLGSHPKLIAISILSFSVIDGQGSRTMEVKGDEGRYWLWLSICGNGDHTTAIYLLIDYQETLVSENGKPFEKLTFRGEGLSLPHWADNRDIRIGSNE